MRRRKLSFLEDGTSFEGNDAEAVWPELRIALRESSKPDDLGLWRLAEDAARVTRRRSALVQSSPRTEPPSPDWPDAA